MTKAEIKKTIRKESLQKRDSIPEGVKEEKSAAVMKHILKLPEFIEAATVLFYASFRSEVDTMAMIKMSLESGKRVVLPKVVATRTRVDKEKNRLTLYEIKDIRELARGYMRIPEPSVDEKRLRTLNEIDLIIIPGAAFDLHGNRLGYGAGYYDKLLAKSQSLIPKPFLIAPAYEEQIVKEIPSEPHDIKVDKIVTDKRVIECV